MMKRVCKDSCIGCWLYRARYGQLATHPTHCLRCSRKEDVPFTRCAFGAKPKKTCMHGYRLVACPDCNKLADLLKRTNYCPGCIVAFLEPERRVDGGGSGLCAACDHIVKHSKEHRVWSLLQRCWPRAQLASGRNVTECNLEGRVRGDVCWVLQHNGQRYKLYLEIDECSHASYDETCELSRYDKLADAQCLVLVVRLSTERSCGMWAFVVHRVAVLLDHLVRLPGVNRRMWPDKPGTVGIAYLRYGFGGKHHIDAALDCLAAGTSVIQRITIFDCCGFQHGASPHVALLPRSTLFTFKAHPAVISAFEFCM